MNSCNIYLDTYEDYANVFGYKLLIEEPNKYIYK